MEAQAHKAREVSRAVLMAALRPDSSAFARLVATDAADVDWPWVLERASAHKLAALLAARVEQCEVVASIAEPVVQRLQTIREEARRRAEVARVTLQDLHAAFARQRIPFLVVKGSVLAELVYRDPAARQFFDVDVVVPPEAIESAEAVLRSLGYRLGQVQKLLAVEPHGDDETRVAEGLTHDFYRRFEYELPFTPIMRGVHLPVDVHWHITPQRRVRLSTHELWQQTMSVVVADIPVLTLNPAATVIHLAVHATTCSFAGFRLLHLCDVAWAVTRFNGPVAGFWELAEAWRVDRHLTAVLDMTERALGVPLPAALRRARPRSLLSGSAFELVARDTFLVGEAAATAPRRWQRVWNETMWSLAMGCLHHNLVRSLRVRLRRLQWRWQRWRLRGNSPA
jgi:hypothetical protein